MKFVKFLFAFSLPLLLLACSSTSSSDKKGQGLDGLSEEELAAMQQDRFGAGSIPLAEGSGLFRDVRFDYNSAIIGDLARQDIEYNVEALHAHPGLKLVFEGHCDDRGTAEYNLALGEERGRAVQRVLNSYGVDTSRLQTISYGEEVPLDPARNDAAFARNRRVHFAPIVR